MLDPVSFEPLLTATLIVTCGHTFNASTLAALPTNQCPLCKCDFDKETGTQPNYALRTVVEMFQKKASSISRGTSSTHAPVPAAAPAPPDKEDSPPLFPLPPINLNGPSHIDLTGDDLRHYPWFHDGISMMDAYALLTQEDVAVGTFLVRPSSRLGHFVFSWLQDKAQPLVTHTLMTPLHTQRYLMDGTSATYPSIAAAVAAGADQGFERFLPRKLQSN
jgi:hypothetical protein